MNKTAGNLIFYAVTAIPAYILILYGLRGTGIASVYGYPNSPMNSAFDLFNFSPDPSFAIYFLIAGFGIIIASIGRALLKYRRK